MGIELAGGPAGIVVAILGLLLLLAPVGTLYRKKSLVARGRYHSGSGCAFDRADFSVLDGLIRRSIRKL